MNKKGDKIISNWDAFIFSYTVGEDSEGNTYHEVARDIKFKSKGINKSNKTDKSDKTNKSDRTNKPDTSESQRDYPPIELSYRFTNLEGENTSHKVFFELAKSGIGFSIIIPDDIPPPINHTK